MAKSALRWLNVGALAALFSLSWRQELILFDEHVDELVTGQGLAPNVIQTLGAVGWGNAAP